VLPNEGEVKFYHHKGFDNFSAVGAAFIGVIQHDYCKFIVAMLPGQTYPLHFHRIKDESYFILSGDLTVTVEDETHTLTKGDVLNVPRRYTHSFRTQNGCVFEEISTAYLNNDSIYEDKEIGQSPRSFRITVLPMSALLDSEEKEAKQ
jgi:N-acetylneuraminate synthase